MNGLSPWELDANEIRKIEGRSFSGCRRIYAIIFLAIHRVILVARLDLIDLYIKIVVTPSERGPIY